MDEGLNYLGQAEIPCKIRNELVISHGEPIEHDDIFGTELAAAIGFPLTSRLTEDVLIGRLLDI